MLLLLDLYVLVEFLNSVNIVELILFDFFPIWEFCK